jgi:hypothetical protein
MRWRTVALVLGFAQLFAAGSVHAHGEIALGLPLTIAGVALGVVLGVWAAVKPTRPVRALGWTVALLYAGFVLWGTLEGHVMSGVVLGLIFVPIAGAVPLAFAYVITLGIARAVKARLYREIIPAGVPPNDEH